MQVCASKSSCEFIVYAILMYAYNTVELVLQENMFQNHYKKNSLRQHTLHSGLEKFRCANLTYNGEIFFLNIPLSESGIDISYVNYCLCGNLQNLTDKLYFWKCCVTLLTQWSSNRCESRCLRQWFLTRCCVIQTTVTFHLKKKHCLINITTTVSKQLSN